MAKTLPFIVVTAALLLLSGCNEKNEENTMIKIVDVEKVISQSSLSTQEKEHLNKVKDTLLAGKKAAEENYAKMSKDDVQKSALADKILLERNWDLQRKQARMATLDTVYTAVEQYRAEKKIILVTHKTAIIAADNSADISDEIIARLKDQQVKYNVLPEISTRDASATTPVANSPADTETQQ